jgi:predicted acetyltransferase
MMTLEKPSLHLLDSYASALRTGWSPNTGRDVSAEQLEQIAQDSAAFIESFTWKPGMTITIDEGRVVDRLPGEVRWMWDGTFCGSINFRHIAGTEDLPAQVSGHIGYAVVPWMRRRGYASHALRDMLPIAAAVGLRRVMVTCDADNTASSGVIEGCGGISLGEPVATPEFPHPKRRYWIATTHQPQDA